MEDSLDPYFVSCKTFCDRIYKAFTVAANVTFDHPFDLKVINKRFHMERFVLSFIGNVSHLFFAFLEQSRHLITYLENNQHREPTLNRFSHERLHVWKLII